MFFLTEKQAVEKFVLRSAIGQDVFHHDVLGSPTAGE
jgi:hypothetical protein